MKNLLSTTIKGGLLALALGMFAVPAQADIITFGNSSGTPSSYTEGIATVTTGQDHIHLDYVDALHGIALRNHDGCCSTPYTLTFSQPVNITSFEYMMGSSDSNLFTTNAAGATPTGLHYFGNFWVYVDVPTQTDHPSDFLGITQITWQQLSGSSTYLDNVTYDLVNPVNPGPGPAPVPEPSTMILLGSGLVGLVTWRLRKPQA